MPVKDVEKKRELERSPEQVETCCAVASRRAAVRRKLATLGEISGAGAG